MTKPQISIIVPVYNAERYLSRCIDSILGQSFRDFELLLIDDGSKDGSGKICDEYAARDNRVQVFHQENRGSSLARKVGFDNAQGEYIVAIDADDWVDHNHLECMMNAMQSTHADIVVTAYWEHNIDGQVIQGDNQPSGADALTWQKDHLQLRCHSGLWNKMFRTELLRSPATLIPRYSYYEDLAITVSYLEQCQKVYYSPIATYHYQITEGSITFHTEAKVRMMRLHEMIKNMHALYDSLSEKKRIILKDDILNCVNFVKWKELLQYPETIHKYRQIYDDFSELSYPISKVKSPTTLCRYLLVHGITYPYRLLTWLKNKK